MVNRTAACFVETGIQLRAIREDLRMTLDALSKETGISRSYISDFERGFRLPTSKYLKYLHDRCQVNLNYVFGSEERKFRTQKDKSPDFGKMQDDVNELLVFMSDVPHALYAVLGYFTEYKLMKKEIIQRHRDEKSEEKVKDKKSPGSF